MSDFEAASNRNATNALICSKGSQAESAELPYLQSFAASLHPNAESGPLPTQLDSRVVKVEPVESDFRRAAPTFSAVRQVDSRVELLVSVRSASEAQLAKQCGVDWIDLKDPNQGPLGAASDAIACEVGKQLADFPQCSAAAGELQDQGFGAAMRLARYFPILKVGLAGMSGVLPVQVNETTFCDWKAALTELATELHSRDASLVSVIYADYKACNAPEPIEIVEFAATAASKWLLFDTFIKDGRSLLDHLPLEKLSALIHAGKCSGMNVVLAGSLSARDVNLLTPLPIAAIGVRGAVCQSDRQSELSKEKLLKWVGEFQSA